VAAGNDVQVPDGLGNGGGSIERFLIADTNNPAGSAKGRSEIFVMWDRAETFVSEFNHLPGVGNVLHVDGHGKFVRYSGKAPATQKWVLA